MECRTVAKAYLLQFLNLTSFATLRDHTRSFVSGFEPKYPCAFIQSVLLFHNFRPRVLGMPLAKIAHAHTYVTAENPGDRDTVLVKREKRKHEVSPRAIAEYIYNVARLMSDIDRRVSGNNYIIHARPLRLERLRESDESSRRTVCENIIQRYLSVSSFAE